METEIKIRQAEPLDIEVLIKMGWKLFPEARSDDELVQTFTETFERDSEVTFIARDDSGKPLGFAIFSVRSDYVEGSEGRPTGYFEAVFIYEEFRRLGLAARFLAVGEDWCRRQGCKQMGSDTHINNVMSQKFHHSVGFREVDRMVCFIKDLK